ncbi:MAG TPA: dNTP triphosphohydrolase, partial [Candidatus Eisenbacteria bacterium]|nr:dNTP triphosphohydrolase [Candidatus Eisenbacteria bacterium]
MKTASPWTRLLSAVREPAAAGAGAPESEARSPFQRDHDRILFSGPFRRLADKTQVFPLPVDDHVHSRLTHSLEVASIGRSLGSLVGAGLAAAGETDAAPRELGDCVAAACLAHDLGNPPFGHVGEQAIREFFAARPDALAGLEARERLDLLRYEGNAQAFRIVTRLERPWRGGGLGLTHATLGAFVKYPCASDAAGAPGAGRSARKHGLMAADVPVWAEIAGALGLPRDPGAARWRRHPLAFLAEAADDVAYLLLDLEDGLRLGHVGEHDYVELVRPLAGA